MGAALLLCARVIVYGAGLVDVAWIASLSALWSRLAPFEHSGTIGLMALLAGTFPLALNHFVTKEDAAARWAEENETRFGWLLRESLESRRMVEVRTTSGDVFVGFVLADAANWESDVALLPVIRAHRDPDTARLVLDANHASEDIEELDELATAIAMSAIVSIGRVDLSLWHPSSHSHSQGKADAAGS